VFAAMLRHEFLEKQNSRVDIKVSAKARLSLQKNKFAESVMVLYGHPKQTFLCVMKWKIRYTFHITVRASKRNLFCTSVFTLKYQRRPLLKNLPDGQNIFDKKVFYI